MEFKHYKFLLLLLLLLSLLLLLIIIIIIRVHNFFSQVELILKY